MQQCRTKIGTLLIPSLRIRTIQRKHVSKDFFIPDSFNVLEELEDITVEKGGPVGKAHFDETNIDFFYLTTPFNFCRKWVTYYVIYNPSVFL